MKNILFLILITIIFTNCLETNVNFELPFEQKAVAFGFIDSVNGARVFVGKNVAIFSKDSSALKDATVSLWADNLLVENLTFLEKNYSVN